MVLFTEPESSYPAGVGSAGLSRGLPTRSVASFRRAQSRHATFTQQQPVSNGAYVHFTDETEGVGVRDAFQAADGAGGTISETQARDHNILPVCVPCYNEDAAELVLTLWHIYEMSLRIPAPEMNVKACVVLDGWAKTSPSMKRLINIFCPSSQLFEGSTWEAKLEGAIREGEKMTCIIQAPPFPLVLLNRQDILGEQWDRVGKGLRGDLDVTFVIKADNRRKHNSHDLFFEGFCSHLKAELGFCTDCGTLFDFDCLGHLVSHMRRNTRLIACTGRQRVMASNMQPGSEDESTWGAIMRRAQGYEYEASAPIYALAYRYLGTLPVIPGPCGLYRVPPLLEKTMWKGTLSPFDVYRNAPMHAAETGTLLDGNCVLAEDRVLTFAALFFTRGNQWSVHLAPEAPYYCQSEDNLRSFTAQRRRWLNGTLAGFIWNLNTLGRDDLPHEQSWLKIAALNALIYITMWINCSVYVAPALYIFTTFISFQAILEDRYPDILAYVIAGVQFAVFLAFSLRHHLIPFDARFYVLAMFSGTVSNIIILIAIVDSLVRGDSFIQWGLFLFIVPVGINLLIRDFTAITKMLNPKWLGSYLLLLPIVQGFLQTMALAQTHNLSWGNRPSATEDDSVEQAKATLRQQSEAMMLGQWLVNGLSLVLLLTIVTPSTTFGLTLVLFIIFFVPFVVVALLAMCDAAGTISCLLFIVIECFLVVPQTPLADYLDEADDWVMKHDPLSLFIGENWLAPKRQVFVFLALVVFKMLLDLVFRCLCSPCTNNRGPPVKRAKLRHEGDAGPTAV